jgi:hypothetical protein
MMNNDFDPYDALIQMNERLHTLEKAHNKMAHAFQASERELNVALHSLRSLQQRYLLLLKRVEETDARLNNNVRS